jgi:hypothetical protein
MQLPCNDGGLLRRNAYLQSVLRYAVLTVPWQPGERQRSLLDQMRKVLGLVRFAF